MKKNRVSVAGSDSDGSVTGVSSWDAEAPTLAEVSRAIKEKDPKLSAFASSAPPEPPEG